METILKPSVKVTIRVFPLVRLPVFEENCGRAVLVEWLEEELLPASDDRQSERRDR